MTNKWQCSNRHCPLYCRPVRWITISTGSPSALSNTVTTGTAPCTADRSGGSPSPLDHHLRCPAVQVAMHKCLKTTEVRRHKDLFFPSISSSQHTPSVAAARCSFQSVSSDTLTTASVSPTSKPSRSSPYAQAQVPRLLQGRIASEFQQDGRRS